jgi:multidrug efflux system outer membrane protein
LLQVKDAKDQVGVARGNLLPSINLGLATGHSFMLSAVEFLLPFLIPSNWFNYNAQKDSFEAEKLSFLIMELNAYSSALSLYYSDRADLEIAKLYQDNANALNQLVKLSRGSVISGTVIPTDIIQVKVQADSAGTQALKLKQTADSEIATLRQMLSFPLSTTITLSQTDLAATTWENMDIQAAVDLANEIAPEHQQIDFLVKAAKQKSYSAKFGWITSALLGAQPSGGSLGTVTGQVNFGLGFALGPTISLANRNIQEVKLTEDVLEQTNTSVLETAINSFKDIKGQLDLSTDGESKAKQVYAFVAQQFQWGTGRFADLLAAYTQITSSSFDRITAQEGVNLQRVVLDRMALSDEFANIKDCGLTAPPSGKKNQSLDQQCKQKAN